MAIATATNQQIFGTYSIQKNKSKFSMAGWMRRPSSLTHQVFGFVDSAQHYFGPYHFNDNVMYFLAANGSTAYGSSAQNITGWNHWAMSFDGTKTGNANRLKGYLNGSPLTLTFLGTIQSTTSNNALSDVFRIGRAQYNGNWSTGNFAEIGMWQEVLSGSDVAALASGMTPDKVLPDKLVSYIPLVRNIQDVRSGISLTNTSTTVANHPRIYP